MFGDKILHRARSLKKLRPDSKAYRHARAPSASSDVSRASSSGSDSPRKENSVEWDPLRLHPSMEVDRAPHMTPLADGIRYHHHDEDAGHSPQHAGQHEQYRPSRHTQPNFNLQVYDGFDFGFSKPPSRKPTHESAGRRLRQPKSEADLRHVSPTPRPRPQGDGVDAFIKRGGWKRQGIVFGVHNEPHESEDDTWEIP